MSEVSSCINWGAFYVQNSLILRRFLTPLGALSNCHASKNRFILLLRDINTPNHQLWKYWSLKRDITYSYRCRSQHKLLFRLRVFGWTIFDLFHVMSLTIPPTILYFLLGIWHSRLPSACAKLRGMVEIVDLDIGESRSDVWLVIMYIFVMILTLSCCQQSHKPLDWILPSAARMTLRTGSSQGNLKQLNIHLLCTPGK